MKANRDKLNYAQQFLTNSGINAKVISIFSKKRNDGKGSRLFLKIKHNISNETIIILFQQLKYGKSIYFPKHTLDQNIKLVNELGKKANPQYICLKVSFEKYGNEIRSKALIKSKKDGKLAFKFVKHLKEGSNPFSEDQDRHEVNVVQPKVLKILKTIKSIVKIEKEVVISKKSRVDFVVTTKENRKIIIEVKSDKKQHSKEKLSDQISRYKKEGKLKYGNAYAKTYLVSENGRYGLSLNELFLKIKQDGF